MKKILTLFSFCVVAFVSMAQERIYFEWKDGSPNLRNIESVDSITFDIPDDAVSLSTGDPDSISTNSMTAKFSISSVLKVVGGNIWCGVCYSSTNANPAVTDSLLWYNGYYIGTQSMEITGLTHNTQYYYRPFLKLGSKEFYGPVKSFVTLEEKQDEEEEDSSWVSLGTGKFVETFLGESGVYYDVEIQQNKQEPNTFRLVEPYAEILGDITVDKYLEFFIQPAGSTFNGMTLDAEYVIFNDYNMGQWNSNYGEDIYALHPYRIGRTPDRWNYNVVLEYQENGLPGVVSLAPIYYLFNEGGGWDKTTSNTISILFPGYVRRDYSASVEFVETLTTNDKSVQAIANLTLGADATDVKAIVMPADADAAAVADAVAAGELETVDVEAGRIEVPFNAEELGGNQFQIIIVVLVEGNVKTIAKDSFAYYGAEGNPWKSLGTGYYTDDVLLPLFYENGATVTYEVEILEHTENPGLYRIMNPYAKSVHPYGDDNYAPEGMFIEVDATDAEGVYIQQQSLGMDWGYGEMQLVTNGARYLASNPFEVVKGAGYLGKVVDGVITFPTFTQNNTTNYQGVLFMGNSGYLVGMNSKIEVTLPNANTFARNMAKAKADNVKRNALRSAFSGVKVSVNPRKMYNFQVEKCGTPNFK